MSERHKEPALDMDITDTIATTSRAMVEKHRHFDPGHDGDIKRQSPDKRFSDTTEHTELRIRPPSRSCTGQDSQHAALQAPRMQGATFTRSDEFAKAEALIALYGLTSAEQASRHQLPYEAVLGRPIRWEDCEDYIAPEPVALEPDRLLPRSKRSVVWWDDGHCGVKVSIDTRDSDIGGPSTERLVRPKLLSAYAHTSVPVQPPPAFLSDQVSAVRLRCMRYSAKPRHRAFFTRPLEAYNDTISLGWLMTFQELQTTFLLRAAPPRYQETTPRQSVSRGEQWFGMYVRLKRRQKDGPAYQQILSTTIEVTARNWDSALAILHRGDYECLKILFWAEQTPLWLAFTREDLERQGMLGLVIGAH